MPESQSLLEIDVWVKKEKVAEEESTRFTRPKYHKCRKCSKCYRHEEQYGQTHLNVPRNPSKAKILKKNEEAHCVPQEQV